MFLGISGRGEVRTYAKNMVGYDIKASGMWTEYLKYDLCENHCLVLFCIVLNSFGRKNLCIVEVTAK